MNEWINHPLLKNIDPVKLDLIQKAAMQTQNKTGKEMAPIMLALITTANKKGIRFSIEEINLIMGLLKEGKTQEEQDHIDRTVQMVENMTKKYQKQ